MKDKYNYESAVRSDIADYLAENCIILTDDNYSTIEDELFTADTVTGNASGSYFFNAWDAEGALCHNFDLLEETAEAFGYEPVITTTYENSAEAWDVRIRCYLLGRILPDFIAD